MGTLELRTRALAYVILRTSSSLFSFPHYQLRAATDPELNPGLPENLFVVARSLKGLKGGADSAGYSTPDDLVRACAFIHINLPA